MSLLPDSFLKSTVFIKNGDSAGTGFLIGVDSGSKDEKGRTLYNLFLVTNRHVIDENKSTIVSIDTESGIKEASILPVDKSWQFPEDEDLDIALTPINPDFLKLIKAEAVFIAEDSIISTKDEFLSRLYVGQEVYLLGFPLGLKGLSKNFPIARQGIIARNDEELLSLDQLYLDINNFPGNSGGPIFVKPSVVRLGDRKVFDQSMLIALVSAYLPYKKTLFDNTTTPPTPKMIIEENSGLAIAIPVYLALNLARDWLVKQTLKEKKDKEIAEVPLQEEA